MNVGLNLSRFVDLKAVFPKSSTGSPLGGRGISKVLLFCRIMVTRESICPCKSVRIGAMVSRVLATISDRFL